MVAVFLYGTLQHAPLFDAVAGCAPAGRPASLPGHAVRAVVGQAFPLLCVDDGAAGAEGLLVDLPDSAVAALDLYEGAFGYTRATRTALCVGDDAPVAAQVYLPADNAWETAGDWNLDHWAASYGAMSAHAVSEVMAIARNPATPDAARVRYPMALARADAHLRAQAASAPARLRRQPAPGDIETVHFDRPYAYFFGVEVSDLRFRRFDGSYSDVARRAAFIMADAVTVLPYDPVRDVVLLVEQFRYGVLARGDRNPWSLECIAGRIDPGEAPQTAARREAEEEARLILTDLTEVSRGYPSPGAVTEYLYNYLALCELPDAAAGVAGVEGEDEDIRSHIVPFQTLMDLIASNEVENGPLITTAFWLALNRDALRRTALSPGA
ncbi:gamma-glutamylcyclotransferase [Roseicitreum antarcticum]|uniref:ADP-ribose pyrophosphatase n=1 Tax=Roseicitreum antarcticum TaxID=564137 RepID=A0A1H2ZZ85_9RHOB|nr:gamma-glutamylcyclotransferase [Roseicitreum antarcticum]SDX22685.1 nudix-type nucleoside diphosphatase, YffH/AdpP family [Roseicitreum antarcticum]